MKKYQTQNEWMNERREKKKLNLIRRKECVAGVAAAWIQSIHAFMQPVKINCMRCAADHVRGDDEEIDEEREEKYFKNIKDK